MLESILQKSFRSGLELQEKRKERAVHFLMVVFQIKMEKAAHIHWHLAFLERYGAFTQLILGQMYLQY